MDEIARFVDESSVRTSVLAVFEEEKRKILARLPSAEVHHVGGTSIPGALTKGDLDVNVRVFAADFERAIDALRAMYAIHQPENWAGGYASFKSDALAVDFGAQLTIVGDSSDFFVTFRDALIASPALLAEYNEIKRAFEGKPMDDYREAKGNFARRVLAQRARGEPALDVVAHSAFLASQDARYGR